MGRPAHRHIATIMMMGLDWMDGLGWMPVVFKLDCCQRCSEDAPLDGQDHGRVRATGKNVATATALNAKSNAFSLEIGHE
jgi:hypothetical protein